MTRRRHHPSTLRLVAALGVAGALVGTGATASNALTLPDPVGTTVGGVSSTVAGAGAALGLPVPGATMPAPSGSTAPPWHPVDGTTSAGTGATSAPRAPSTSRSTTSPSTSSGSAPKAPAGRAVADAPAATACLIPAGGSSPAVEVDLRAAGVDLSSPLVKQFPQALDPCPAGAVPADDHVAAVDAALQGLLGACVRVTRQVVPLQTTLVVLDHDVIEELTAAGVPLQHLVVPCPRTAGSPAPGGRPSGSAPSGLAGGDQPGVASALPGRLAFTGGDLVPPAMVGAGLLWLGVLLTRRARALSARAGRG